MSVKYETFADSVSAMQEKKTLRRLRPMVPIDGAHILLDNKKMLSFCSHDYLGLAGSPGIKKNAIKYLLEHGITASSESRDLYTTCQQELERKLSDMLHRETTLFFPSRYEANTTTLSTLGHKEVAFFLDEACHCSLVRGARGSKAKVLTYPHGKLDRLEIFLEDCKQKTKVIVTESVFSLTGNVANLPTLIELAEYFDALLYVDDSHAFGTSGVEGMGLAAHLKEIDIIAGSLSKAVGAYGGYISCSETIRDYLTSLAPYQTAFLFPPPIIGAIEAALDQFPQAEGERKKLQQRSHWLRETLRGMGFAIPKANIPLISLLFRSTEEVDSLRSFLKSEEILVGPTRSYEGEICRPRLNIALNVCHMPDHLNRLVEAIQKWQNN